MLLLLNVFGVMQPQAQSWYLLLLIIAAVLIQWAVLILVLHLRSDEEGTYCEMDAGTWSLTFLPIVALVFAFIVMYVSLHSTVSFFALEFTDFLVMFAVFAAVCVFCYLLSYAYRLATNGKRDSGVRFGRKKRSEKEREQEIPRRAGTGKRGKGGRDRLSRSSGNGQGIFASSLYPFALFSGDAAQTLRRVQYVPGKQGNVL